jgi:hypothetical protein
LCGSRGSLCRRASNRIFSGRLTAHQTAARKLIEIASTDEAVQDGRIYIELLNQPFLDAGAAPDGG